MIRLRELREKRGISMKDAAGFLNIPYTTYVNYEKGTREPNIEALFRLADFFEVTIDELLERCAPNETPPCYQPDGDGCAYQCYDGDDEPIDKCKECPLCYSDKQRHHAPPNEPLPVLVNDEPDREYIDYICPR